MDSPQEQNTQAEKQDLFMTTHWSILCQVGDNDSTRSRNALEQLCSRYWYPVYVFIRSRGYNEHDAEDLTQGFFADLLKRNDLAGLSRGAGRFRGFLLASIKNYLANERKKVGARKRGGGQVVIPLDGEWAMRQFETHHHDSLSPDRQFDRSWAMELLRSVLADLKADYHAKGQSELFDHLKFSLQGDRSEKPYRQLAADLGVTESAIKVSIHRLREQYRKKLKQAVSETTATLADAEEESRELLNLLR